HQPHARLASRLGGIPPPRLRGSHPQARQVELDVRRLNALQPPGGSLLVPRQGRMSHLFKLCTIVSVAAALAGCSNPYPPDLVPPVQTEDAAPELYRPALDSDYTIGPDDGLVIQSYYDAGLKQQALVRPDGRVSLLLIGEVMAAGKTPMQLADELTHMYARQLDRPDITVSLTSSAGMVVYVGGDVTKP